MELKVVNDHANKLLDRREVSFEVKHDKATPSRKEVRELLAAKLTVDDKLVVVQSFIPVYGGAVIKGNANIYAKPETMKKVEIVPMLKRNFPEIFEKKEAQAGAEAATGTEAPANTEGAK